MSANVSTEEKDLSPKQYALIKALVAGNPIVVSAKIAGVAEKTAHTWLRLPHFKAEYMQAKQEIFGTSLDKMRDGIDLAIDTLKRNMTEGRGYVQVQAATTWLNVTIELYKMSELEKKVLELEELLRAR